MRKEKSFLGQLSECNQKNCGIPLNVKAIEAEKRYNEYVQNLKKETKSYL